ncbi:60S ribosomal protein L37 [Obelidium mucronatum]|nr:60S ribosomal protein L37 [Obelidium mucronatum]
MTKGTQSFGKRHNKSHTLCRRCGRRFLPRPKEDLCSMWLPSCQAQILKTTGTGRCAYIKTLTRRFKNGFREGTLSAL